MKSFLIHLAVLGHLMVILPSCTHLKKPKTLPVDVSCSPRQMVSTIDQDDRPWGLKGMAKIKVKSPDETFSANELILAQRPGCLRLETFNPLGQPVFFAVTDGEELSLFSPSEKKFYRGVASPEHLSLFIPLHLSLEEIISILLGDVPLIDYDAEKIDGWVEEDRCWVRLSSDDGRLKQVLKVSLFNQQVVESNTYEDEALTLTIQYERYDEVEGTLFPREIRVSMPRDETEVRIRFKAIEFFSTLHADVFQLEPPEGVDLIWLE